jgi:hypothetical protein
MGSIFLRKYLDFSHSLLTRLACWLSVPCYRSYTVDICLTWVNFGKMITQIYFQRELSSFLSWEINHFIVTILKFVFQVFGGYWVCCATIYLHHLLPKHLCHTEKKPHSHHCWQPLSVCMDLPVLGIMYKCSHSICDLCVWLLLVSIMFSAYTCHSIYISFLLWLFNIFVWLYQFLF